MPIINLSTLICSGEHTVQHSIMNPWNFLSKQCEFHSDTFQKSLGEFWRVLSCHRILARESYYLSQYSKYLCDWWFLMTKVWNKVKLAFDHVSSLLLLCGKYLCSENCVYSVHQTLFILKVWLLNLASKIHMKPLQQWIWFNWLKFQESTKLQ